FIERVNSFTLQILKDTDFKGLFIRESWIDDGRDFGLACDLRRAPASFPADQLELTGSTIGAKQNGLAYSMNLDGVGEFFQSDLIEMLSWIVWVGRYRREWNALQIVGWNCRF